MKFNNLFWFAVAAMVLSSGAMAFSYKAPIEPDNGLEILGEGPNISCTPFLCEYQFEIKSNVASEHALDIEPFFYGDAEVISIERAETTSWTEKEEYCDEYNTVTDDNGTIRKTDCKKLLIRDILKTKQHFVKIALFDKKDELDFEGKKFKKDKESEKLQGNGIQKYRLVFKPINSTGQLIIKTKSKSDNSIKASLDPWWYASALKRFPIRITATANYDTNTTLFIRDINTTTADWAGCSNNQVLIVKQDTNTVLDRIIDGNCGATQDMNIAFRLPIALNSGMDYNGTDTNGLMIYISDYNLSADKILEYSDYNEVFWFGDDFITDTRANYTNHCSASSHNAEGSVTCNSATGEQALRYKIGVTPSNLLVQVRFKGSGSNGRTVCLNDLGSNSSNRGHCFGERDNAVKFFQPNVSNNTSTGIDTAANTYYTTQLLEVTDANMYGSIINTDTGSLNQPNLFAASSYQNRLVTSETGLADYSNVFISLGMEVMATGDTTIDWWRAFKYISPGVISLGPAGTPGPTMADLNRSPSSGKLIVGQNIKVMPTDLAHPTNVALKFYCTESGAAPTSANTLCTEADTSYSSPYNAQCTYAVTAGAADRNVSCRAYDGSNYSDIVKEPYSISGNSLTIAFTNEKTGAGAKPTTLTIDGNNWLGVVDANGLLYIANLTAFSIGVKTIAVTKTGYGSRTWDLNFGANLGNDYNFAMLELSTGKNIDFQIQNPSETGYLAGYQAIPIVSQFLWAGSKWTDSIGKATFYVDSNNAEGYVWDFNTLTASEHYTNTKVRVLLPKSEKTLEDINPWRLELGGLAQYRDYNGLTTYQDFNVFSNTVDYYKIVVSDANSNVYFQRTLSFRSPGDTNLLTIEPFLPHVADGLTSTVFTLNPYTKAFLSGILVKVNRDLNGTVQTVFSNKTDSAGTVSVSWIYLQDYNLLFYYPDENNLINQGFVEPKSSNYYVYLDINSGNFTDSNTIFTDINFNGSSTLTAASNLVNTIQDVAGQYLQSVTISITQDSTSLYNHTFNAGSPELTTTTGHFDQNLAIAGINRNKPLKVTVTVTRSDGKTYNESKSYYVLLPGEQNFKTNVSVLISEWGSFGSALLALFITLLIVGSLTFYMNIGGNNAVIIGMLCLGIFTYFGFFSAMLYFAMLMAGFVFYMLFRRDVE